MKRFFAILASLLLLLYARESLAQCSGSTVQGTANLICVGSAAQTNTIAAGRYYLLNVIGGLQYSISNPSALSGVTVTTADGNTIIANSSTGGVSFSATYSGQVRVYNCAALLSYNIGYSVIGGTNNVDNSLAAGTNQWVEHYYKRLDATAGPPTDGNAFGRYLGTSLSGQAETFITTYGGNTADGNCVDVYSQSIARTSFLTSFFAARYRMTSTRAKGVYLADLSADDGVRLTVDGVLVFNRWIEQGVTTYSKQMFKLTGNSNLLLEYYESAGGNELRFQNLVRVANTIAGGDQVICQGGTITALTGNNTLTDAPISNTTGFTVTYQWQQSTDSVTFTNATGTSTGQNYTPPTTTAGVFYYRRLAYITRTNSGMSNSSTLDDESNIIKATILAPPTVNLSGSTAVCQNATAPNLTFINPQNRAITVIYKINGGANQSLNIAASSTATVAVPATTVGTYAYVVNSVAYQGTPACSTTVTAPTATVTVRVNPNGAITSVASPVCRGTAVQLRFTAGQGTGPFSLVINGTTYTGITSGSPFNVVPNINSTTTFNLTKITDANGCVLQSP